MFLNYIKDFFVKRRLKLSLQNVKGTTLTTAVKTVGLLVDESYFLEKESLIKELKANGIAEENIAIIVYRDKFRKSEGYERPTFGPKNLNWNVVIDNVIINDFVNEEFDLLISYYDIEKALLLLITSNSKAKFKVGFSSVDKRLNHFMINTNAENHTVFTQELFKYLKILNKI